MILIVGSTSTKTAEFSITNKLGISALYEGKLTNGQIYHTSMADCLDLEKHLSFFETIYWAKSEQSEFKNFKEYFETLFLLKQHGGVIGLDNDPYNIRDNFKIVNREDHAVFLGCSHTAGGFVLPNEEYYNIVSSYFNLEPLNLARAGKGNYLSFNIFNQIDFYKNQIVVLQLSDFARLRYFPNTLPNTKLNEDQLHLIKNSAYIEVFNDKQLLYNTLSYLDFVVKYSRSFGLRFVFFYLGDVSNFNNDPANDQYKKTVEFYLSDYREYVPNVLSKCIDRGNDNQHWGKLSNQMFANEIIKKIETLY